MRNALLLPVAAVLIFSGCAPPPAQIVDASSARPAARVDVASEPTVEPTAETPAGKTPKPAPTVTITVTAQPAAVAVPVRQCSEFESRADAKAYLQERPDAAEELDGDGDGRPCENTFKGKREDAERQARDCSPAVECANPEWDKEASRFIAETGGACDMAEDGAPICEGGGMVYDPGGHLSECDEFFVWIDYVLEYDEADVEWARENCGVDLNSYESPS